METKICKSCHNERPLEAFALTDTSVISPKRATSCEDCRKEDISKIRTANDIRHGSVLPVLRSLNYNIFKEGWAKQDLCGLKKIQILKKRKALYGNIC